MDLLCCQKAVESGAGSSDPRIGKVKAALQEIQNRLREAIGTHYARVRARFAYLVGSVEIVEDLSQEVFTRVWEALSAEREIRDLDGFIQGTVRNVFLQYLRAKASQANTVHLSDDLDRDPRPPPSQVVEEADTRQRLRDLLGALDPEERWLIIGKHFFGMSGGELAESVDRPRRTVVDWYNRTMDKFRRLALQQGIAL